MTHVLTAPHQVQVHGRTAELVGCFYMGENVLAIQPDERIGCGVCEPECPAEAVVPGGSRLVDAALQGVVLRGSFPIPACASGMQLASMPRQRPGHVPPAEWIEAPRAVETSTDARTMRPA